MGKLNIVGQNIKGHVQQIKGGIEVAAGQNLKGNIDKLKGKANVLEADLKMKVENSK